MAGFSLRSINGRDEIIDTDQNLKNIAKSFSSSGSSSKSVNNTNSSNNASGTANATDEEEVKRKALHKQKIARAYQNKVEKNIKESGRDIKAKDIQVVDKESKTFKIDQWNKNGEDRNFQLVDSNEEDKKGPYFHLKDGKTVGPGKKFTKSQKKKLIEANKEKNNGVVKSDSSGIDLVQPKKSEKGITPPADEWQVDHIEPKSKEGSNSFSNAQILSRKENRDKSDN